MASAVAELALASINPGSRSVGAGWLAPDATFPAGLAIITSSGAGLLVPPGFQQSAEHYVGTIRRFGSVFGRHGTGALDWIVLASTSSFGAGALAGVRRRGRFGDHGVGVGANALVGGSNRTPPPALLGPGAGRRRCRRRRHRCRAGIYPAAAPGAPPASRRHKR